MTNLGVLPSYSEIFPEEKIDFDNLLKSLPKDYLLKKCAQISASIFGQEYNRDIQNQIFLSLTRVLTKSAQDNIAYELNKHVNIFLASHISCLVLMQSKLLRDSDNEVDTSPERMDFEIFKLILMSNEIFTETMQPLKKLIDSADNDIKLLYAFILMEIGQSDIARPDSRNNYSQLIKCRDFF